MKNFKVKYEKLDREVLDALRKKVEKSTYQSVHVSVKALKIVGFYRGCGELALLHDKLTLINPDGYHYDIQNEDLRALTFLLCN